MAQIIKIKRGGISSLVSSTPTLQQGELLLATGSVNGLGSTFFVADATNSPELPYAKIESIADGATLASNLDGNFEGLLIHSASDNKLYRYNGTAFVELPIAAGSFIGTLPVANGGTNATSFADKSVIVSQDSGTDTLSAKQMDGNGELLIGGTSGPEVATLTEGTGLTITNGNGSITIATNDGEIVHDSLSGFVANEHINHSSVTLTAGSGLTGGGDITTNRTFNVGAGDGISVAADSVAVDATVLRTTGDGVVSGSGQIDHDQTANFVSNEHIDHSSVSITAGSGLTGGGNITTTRTINVGAGDGISVAADSVAVDATVLRTTGDGVVSGSSQINHDSTTGFVANEHINHSSVTLTAGSGLTGGGDITTNRTFNIGEGTGITVAADSISTNDSEIVHDNLSGFVANEHINHTSVSITAGSGLSGGGTIAATRTLTLDTGSQHFSNGIFKNVSSMVAGNTETLITVTYQSADSTLDFVVNDDLSQYDNTTSGFYDSDSDVGLAGDLSGTAAAATVTKVQGVALTSGEATQLANIGATTISATQWGYLGVMNQNVRTTDAVSFATVNTGQGATEVHLMNQNVRSTDSPTFAGLTITGDLSVQGTLTTVNSNEVEIGDRIIELNTADGAGDAGLYVRDTNTAETGSLLWDTDGNYWKTGVVGGSDYRLVEWDGETAGAGDFIHTDSNGRINAINTSTAGDLLISDGDGTFTVTNVIDGGTF